MIKITTDKQIREELSRELNRRDEMRWMSERIDRLEMRIHELAHRLDILTPSVAVNREETAVMPK